MRVVQNSVPSLWMRIGGVDERAFPLAKVLEGGTWQAGREIAREKRADATPPIRIQSDGTLF